MRGLTEGAVLLALLRRQIEERGFRPQASMIRSWRESNQLYSYGNLPRIGRSALWVYGRSKESFIGATFLAE